MLRTLHGAEHVFGNLNLLPIGRVAVRQRVQGRNGCAFDCLQSQSAQNAVQVGAERVHVQRCDATLHAGFGCCEVFEYTMPQEPRFLTRSEVSICFIRSVWRRNMPV